MVNKIKLGLTGLHLLTLFTLVLIFYLCHLIGEVYL